MKNLPTDPKLLITLLKRFHLVIFTVIVTIVLSVSVLLLYSVVIKAGGSEATTPNANAPAFDQTTIDRVNQLKTSDQPSEPLDFSQGRINPFGE